LIDRCIDGPFIGRRYQCGHRLAETISGLFKRFVMPIVTLAAKCIGKQILGNVAKTGMEVAGDVIGGRNIKETMKDRGLAGIKRTVAEIVDQSLVDKQRPQKKKKKTASIADKNQTTASASAERRLCMRQKQ